RLYGPITWTTGILYTIPSLALFALLIPYTGLSLLSAEIGLVSYTLLILIRNIVAGVRGVPAEVRDAARGMGYTDRQILWRVELPLALSAISVVVALLIAMPIALYLGHTGRAGFVAINVANVGRALPSLALLAFGLVIAISLGLGLGFWPTVFALVPLAIPPILTNSYVAVREVDRDI